LMLLLALPVAAFKFVFQPRNQQIQTAQQQISQKRSKLSQLQQATRRIDDLGQEIERLSRAVVLFEQKLPAQREVEVVLKEVWQLASQQGLTPKSVRTDEPDINIMYAQLPLRMVIIGDFDGFYSFLLDLEKLQRITRLPQLKLVKSKDVEGQIKADMVLHIFYEHKGENIL